MILQTTGPISMSDIATEFCPFTTVFTFVAGTGTNGATTHDGIRTALPIPGGAFGAWVSPLPLISLGGTEGNVTSPQLFSDGFNYSCGGVFNSTTGNNQSFGISLSRWNGITFDLANGSWTPFNTIIINGPLWSNVTFTLFPDLFTTSQGHEFIAIKTAITTTIPFITGSTYTITFT